MNGPAADRLCNVAFGGLSSLVVKRIWAIVNPVSGRRNRARCLGHVGREIEARGGRMRVVLTRGAGDAARLAAEAPDDTHSILVLGGDGTVSEAVRGMIDAGRRIPVVILRTGTENLIAKEFDMPTEPAALADALLNGRVLDADIGYANDRPFLMVCGVGFDGEVVHRLNSVRNGHITHWHYFWPIARTFAGHRFPRLKIEADGETCFDGQGLAFVGVIPRYSVGLQLLKNARFDDGLLDLCVLPCRTPQRLVGHALMTVLRRHDRMPEVIYRKAKRIRITSPDDAKVQIDGDPGVAMPVEFRVQPKAAAFQTSANGIASPLV